MVVNVVLEAHVGMVSVVVHQAQRGNFVQMMYWNVNQILATMEELVKSFILDTYVPVQMVSQSIQYDLIF